jgi:hypothetical protein
MIGKGASSDSVWRAAYSERREYTAYPEWRAYYEKIKSELVKKDDVLQKDYDSQILILKQDLEVIFHYFCEIHKDMNPLESSARDKYIYFIKRQWKDIKDELIDFTHVSDHNKEQEKQ